MVGFNQSNLPVNTPEGHLAVDTYIWDTNTLAWIKDTGGGGGAGGNVTVDNFPSSYPVTDNGGSLTVDGTITANAGSGTFAASVSSLPLPSGAAQEHTTAGSPSSTRLTDGSAFYKATTPSDTQPISAASLPLPTGASTAAKQPALGTAGAASSDVVTIQGIASMTAVKTDGSAVTQPVSGTVTANAGSGTFTVGDGGSTLSIDDGSGSITVDGTVTANAGSGTFATSNTSIDVALSTRLAESTFTGRINTLGQKTMANSTPVVLSSDQTVIPISDNGGSLTVDGTVTANAGSGTFVVGDGGSSISVDDNGGSLTVDGAVAATQSGSWTVINGGASKTLKTASFSLSATGTVVSAVASKRIKVYAVKLVVSAALSVNFRDGASTGLEGAQALAANGGFTESNVPPAFLFATSAGNSLDLVISGTGTAAGRVSYWDDDAA